MSRAQTLKVGIGLLALTALATSALAQVGIHVTTFPIRSVADGRSQITVTAEVRDSNGRIVPDGTSVVFSTTLGAFRESVKTTAGGIARAVLVAGSTPGIARVTVKALAGNAPPTTYEVEFVANRELLSTAKEYIEVVAPDQMEYTADSRYLAASGTDKPVFIRYRDITVEASDIQIDVPNYVLRARKAHVKYGKIDRDFDEIFLKLNQRSGFGTTTVPSASFDGITWDGHSFRAITQNTDGTWETAQPREKYAVVAIKAGQIDTPSDPVNIQALKFEDASVGTSSIRAKKAVVFPRKGIQFQKAQVFVGTTKVMEMPLYELSLQAQNTPLVTDSIVSVRDNQLAVNYPYYLSLKPGQTSLVRLRTGDQIGRSSSAQGGVFLDYELNWNQGDAMDGGINFIGIGRNDWSLGVRNTWQFDDRTSLYVQAQTPFGESVFGNFGLSRQFDGFQASMQGNYTNQFRGRNYTATDASFNLETDPIKMGMFPARIFYGATAFDQYNSLIADRQTSYGLFTRLQSIPIKLDGTTTLSSSFMVKGLAGTEAQRGLTYIGNATVGKQFGPEFSTVLTYDFVRNRFDDAVLGSHRLSLQGYYNKGRTFASLLASRSLDVDRVSLYGDLSYQVGGPWRLGYSYTFDQAIGSTYIDDSYTIGYRVGWREVGLTWSRATHRIGFQILGATIN